MPGPGNVQYVAVAGDGDHKVAAADVQGAIVAGYGPVATPSVDVVDGPRHGGRGRKWIGRGDSVGRGGGEERKADRPDDPGAQFT
jgi:hypothetical protein